MLTRCSTCGEPVQPVGPQGTEVTVGTIAGVREGPRRWACPEGHEQVTVDATAGAAEVLAAFDVARPRRLRRGECCAACGELLVLPGRRTVRTVTLVDAGVPALRLSLDVPLLRCTQDAVENLPAACEADLTAVANALLGDDGGGAN